MLDRAPSKKQVPELQTSRPADKMFHVAMGCDDMEFFHSFSNASVACRLLSSITKQYQPRSNPRKASHDGK